jgi:hypothetical protein
MQYRYAPESEISLEEKNLKLRELFEDLPRCNYELFKVLLELSLDVRILATNSVICLLRALVCFLGFALTPSVTHSVSLASLYH